MSKLGLLRTSITATPAVRAAAAQSRGLISLLREPARRFSTEAENPPPESSPADQPHQPSPIDPFLQTPNSGVMYGRLTGISRNTLRTDIVNFLEGCNLGLEDVKVDYTRNYVPTAMLCVLLSLEFRTRQAFDNAVRVIQRKGRLYKLDRGNQSQWDGIAPYDGKTVLLQGLPVTAVPEDVERFLSGCEFDSSSLQVFTRASPVPNKIATVRFHSQTEAMNALLMKNKGFCQNGQVLVRVLQ